MEGKRCSKCGTWQPFSEFYADARRSDGHQARCRTCWCKRLRVERAADPERIRARDRQPARKQRRNAFLRQKWQNDEEFRQRSRDITRRARYRALLGGLTLDELIERDGSVCYLCGEHVKPVDAEPDHVIAHRRGGLDIPENVALAHRLCNQRKTLYLVSELTWPIPSALDREKQALAAMPGVVPVRLSRVPWTVEESERLSSLWHTDITWDDLTATVGRTRYAIGHQAKVLGLERVYRPSGPGGRRIIDRRGVRRERAIAREVAVFHDIMEK